MTPSQDAPFLQELDAATTGLRETGIIQAYDVNVLQVTLQAGRPVRIVIEGDGDTNLDASLFDENGNEIARDTDPLYHCWLDACPRWTGKFEVRISNLGNVWNRYSIYIE